MERYARIEASERAESMSSPRVSRERIHFFRPVMVGTTRRVRSLVTLAAHAVLVCARADAYSLFISSLQVLLQPAQTSNPSQGAFPHALSSLLVTLYLPTLMAVYRWISGCGSTQRRPTPLARLARVTGRTQATAGARGTRRRRRQRRYWQIWGAK